MILKISLLFIFGLLSLSFVSGAIPVGISPGTIEFRNTLRGGYAERYITISIGSEELTGVTFEPRGEIADWLGYPEALNASRASNARALITVEPPSDTPNGNYTGFLRVYTSGLGDGEGGEGRATGIVQAVVDIAITVEVTDLEILSCSAFGYSVQSAEQGDDLLLSFSFENSGNIRLKPDAFVEIWGPDQIEIIDSFSLVGEEVLPTQQDQVEFRISSEDLELSQYWLEVSVPDCFSSDTLTFDVYAPGTLRSRGTLLRIDVPFAIETGDTTPIDAVFQNIGEKEVEAKFEGKISREGKIIQLLESDVQLVSINEISTFPFFFTPEDPGSYLVSGRVLYDRKKTFELSESFIVADGALSFGDIVLWSIYVLLILIVAILFFKIRKEKKVIKETLGGFR